MNDKRNELGLWQLSHYQSVELVRLNKLIAEYADEAGSISALIKTASQRFKTKKYVPFENNNISSLRRDDTNGRPVKSSAIADCSIYKLALLFDIDGDLVWGGLILRLYLSGKIDNIGQPTIDAIKQACKLQPKMAIDLDILQWIEQASPKDLKGIAVLAVTKLAEQNKDKEPGAPKASLLKYIQAVLKSEGLTLDDLTTNTAVSAKTLDKLNNTGALHDYELNSLAAWFSDVTGKTITSDALAEVYEVKVCNGPTC